MPAASHSHGNDPMREFASLATMSVGTSRGLGMIETQSFIAVIGEIIDIAGVVVIATGAVIGIGLFARDLARQVQLIDAYGRLRTFLGRSLLLGLEFLVAGDVIKTVAVEPTFDSVVVLAIIVLVRTVLSLSIDVEVDGRWPWQAAATQSARGQSSENTSAGTWSEGRGDR
jgi:uncharacterized membrane protein